MIQEILVLMNQCNAIVTTLTKALKENKGQIVELLDEVNNLDLHRRFATIKAEAYLEMVKLGVPGDHAAMMLSGPLKSK